TPDPAFGGTVREIVDSDFNGKLAASIREMLGRRRGVYSERGVRRVSEFTSRVERGEVRFVY
ncbi:MAG: hypothetical protein ACTSU5_17040, partial [Promethearchaeota archaeon]